MRRHKTLAKIYFFLHYLKIWFLKYAVRKKLRKRLFIAISLIEHLGDIVASEPISRYIRKKYPNAYILWCVRKPYKELIDHNPNIDKTLIVNCLTEWMYLRNSGIFDDVVDLHFHGRSCPICRIPITKSIDQREVSHANYLFFGSLLKAFCKTAKLPELDEPPKVFIPTIVELKINSYKLPKSFIVVHCISNMPIKDWPISNWQKLIEAIEQHWEIAIVEIGLESALNKIEIPRYIDLTGKTSIIETAEVIKRSQLFIGVESGPAHLANAVGSKGLIMISQFAYFKTYIPYSGNFAKSVNSELVYGEGSVAEIPVERVYESVNRLLCN